MPPSSAQAFPGVGVRSEPDQQWARVRDQVILPILSLPSLPCGPTFPSASPPTNT